MTSQFIYPFMIVVPAHKSFVASLSRISGIGDAGKQVSVRVAGRLLLPDALILEAVFSTAVAEDGAWFVEIPGTFDDGDVLIEAAMESGHPSGDTENDEPVPETRLLKVTIKNNALPAPSIIAPVRESSIITDTFIIAGGSLPGAEIALTIDNELIARATADNHYYYWSEAKKPPSGRHVLGVCQKDTTTGIVSGTTSIVFFSD